MRAAYTRIVAAGGTPVRARTYYCLSSWCIVVVSGSLGRGSGDGGGRRRDVDLKIQPNRIIIKRKKK